MYEYSSQPEVAITPLIETERLLLRPHRIDDFPAALRMWVDPNVVRFIGGIPSSEQQVWMRILNYAGHWALLGFGYWAVEEKATDEFIGEIGFANFHRTIAPAMQNVPEAGWAFVSRVHGQGYATEALRAVLAWGDVYLASPRTVCLIGAENHASRRVAEKCGYRTFEQSEFMGEPTIFFERFLP
jgi:RimJ/RimL family protein N-acetyltransferase